MPKPKQDRQLVSLADLLLGMQTSDISNPFSRKNHRAFLALSERARRKKLADFYRREAKTSINIHAKTTRIA